MATLDSSTKVNIGVLLSILALGTGGIWKVAELSASIAVADTRLANIEQGIKALVEDGKQYIRRAEFDLRVRSTDARLDRLEAQIDKIAK